MAVTGLLVPVAFYVIARFRTPVLPALAILGGAYAVWLLRTARRAFERDAGARTRLAAAQ